MNALRRVLLAAAALVALAAGTPCLAQKGWVILTATSADAYNEVMITVQPVGKRDDRFGLGFGTNSPFVDTRRNWEGHRGVIRVRELPAGDYVMTNYRLHDTTLRKSWYLTKDFAVAFQVHAGEISYLGEFQATGIRVKALIGHYIERPYFLVSDQQARDIPLAVEDFPELKGIPVRNAFPRDALVRLPSFRVERLPDKL